MITAVGVGIGPFYAGFLVQYGPDPLTLSFWILLALLLPALVATWMIREPSHAVPGTAPATAPVSRLPPGVRPVFVLSALAAFVGFALAGIFSGLAPSFLVSDLHITNHALAGATVLLMFGSAAIAQLLGQQRRSHPMTRLGAVLAPVGLVSIASAAWTGLAFPFFVGTVLCGAGFGLALMGGLGMLNQVAPPDRRGEVLSGFYVAAYLGLSVPIVGIGVIADSFGLAVAVVVFSIVISALSLTVILSREPALEPAAPSLPARSSSSN